VAPAVAVAIDSENGALTADEEGSNVGAAARVFAASGSCAVASGEGADEHPIAATTARSRPRRSCIAR
jgi:hypothetical protein